MKEHKTPCICNTCLRAKDKELKAQRKNIIRMIGEKAFDYQIAIEITKENKFFNKGIRKLKRVLIKALKDEE